MVDTSELETYLRPLHVELDEFIQAVVEKGIPYPYEDYVRDGRLTIVRALEEIGSVAFFGHWIDAQVRVTLGLEFEDWAHTDDKIDLQEFEENQQIAFWIRYTATHEHVPINTVRFERTDQIDIQYECTIDPRGVENVKHSLDTMDFQMFYRDVLEIPSDVDVDVEMTVKNENSMPPTLKLRITNDSLDAPPIHKIYDIFKTIIQDARTLDTRQKITMTAEAGEDYYLNWVTGSILSYVRNEQEYDWVIGIINTALESHHLKKRDVRIILKTIEKTVESINTERLNDLMQEYDRRVING